MILHYVISFRWSFNTRISYVQLCLQRGVNQLCPTPCRSRRLCPTPCRPRRCDTRLYRNSTKDILSVNAIESLIMLNWACAWICGILGTCLPSVMSFLGRAKGHIFCLLVLLSWWWIDDEVRADKIKDIKRSTLIPWRWWNPGLFTIIVPATCT